MSIPKHFYLMVDTETCGTIDNAYVYDLGMAIVDRHGRVYAKYSFIINEVFYGMPELMATSYYSNKLPQYFEDIAMGRRKVVGFWFARAIAHALIEKWNCVAVVAHNARFDYNALNNTATALGNGITKMYFFPKIPIWCTLTMARQIYPNRPTYRNFCDKHKYYTANGQPRLTAEILYRFITGDNDFIESHTGLEDVMIEKEILVHILRQHKKIRKTYYNE